MRTALLENIDWTLYVIVDAEWLRGRKVGDVVRQLINGGAGVVQYRDKVSDSYQFYARCKEIHNITKNSGIPLIINDRFDIALVVGAEGVHLGQKDLPVDEVRKVIGNKMIIGGSIHDEAEYERMADADYLGIGSIFPTDTKDDVKICGLDMVRKIRRKTARPLIGIGGINKKNAGSVIKAGCDGVAVISSVMGSDNIREAVREFKNILKLEVK